MCKWHINPFWEGWSGEWCNLSQVSLQQLNRNYFRLLHIVKWWWFLKIFGLHASSASVQQMQSNRHAYKYSSSSNTNTSRIISSSWCVVTIPQNFPSTFQCFFFRSSKMQNKTKCHNHINCFISSTQFRIFYVAVVVFVIAIVFFVPNSFAMHSTSPWTSRACNAHKSNFYSIILAKIMAKCEQCHCNSHHRTALFAFIRNLQFAYHLFIMDFIWHWWVQWSTKAKKKPSNYFEWMSKSFSQHASFHPMYASQFAY